MNITKTVLKTGTSLAAFLDGVIEESVKSVLYNKTLQEKEKQQKSSASTQSLSGDSGGGDDSTDLFGSDDSSGGNSTGQNDNSKTMDDDSEALQSGEIETQDIVDKLNTIRSGKSFRDDRISAAMDEYVGSLTKAEKTALLAFMKGISEIVSGQIPGEQATEPEETPSDVSMQKGDRIKMKHVSPNVIKASPPKHKSGSSKEDTSSPTPITPKKRGL